MALRFDATTEDYSSTSGMPTTVYSVLFWFKISVDPNALRQIWSFDTGSTSTNYTFLGTVADGTTLELQMQGGTDANSFAATTVGTWYRFALVRNGANASYYLGAAGSSLTTSAFASDWGSATTAPTTRRLGESVNGSDAFNGCLANYKEYTAALTAAEVEAELSQYEPVRTANLNLRSPFIIGTDTADYSGNGRSWTSSGTITTEDGPPIPWAALSPAAILL